MIIDLRTISTGSRSLEFVLEKDWWRSDGQKDQILGIDTPVRVKMKIDGSAGKYVVDGELAGGIEVICDRCLKAYHRELKTVFRVFFALPLAEADQKETELAEEDLEVDFIREDEIDLDEIIREQIYLSLPMKSLCTENCLGLCPICGSNLNVGDCQCDHEQGHPAFLKLKHLKTKGE